MSSITSRLENVKKLQAKRWENEKALFYLKKALHLGSNDKNLFVNLAVVLIYMEKHQEEYLEYLEEVEDKTEDPLTFKAYFDPQSH